MDYANFKELADIGLGRKKAQLVLKNVGILNVFSEEIYIGDIAIEDGLIIGVGTYEGIIEKDLTGKFVVPGFIDAHLHLETTMVSPAELVHNALQWGTTTYLIDPHEAANVAGTDGIDYMLEQTEEVDANVYVMMPSCVPATEYEDNGCVLDAKLMAPYLDNPRVLGLGEVMDYNSVILADEGMMKKLSLFQHRIIDGHAPFLNEKQINTYALAGIMTDHECTTYEYAVQELRNGMQVLIREGSGARNLEAIVTGIVKNQIDTVGFSFCTDDKHVEDIRREGHISYNIKKSISLGLPPVKAYKMATYNTAQKYRLNHLGAVAPGYQADLVVLDDFTDVIISEVYYKGRLVQEADGFKLRPCPEYLKHTVHIAPLTLASLQIEIFAQTPILEMIPGQITTRILYEPLPGQQGLFCATGIYNKAVVIERHKASGKVGVGVVKGFCLSGGAIATSVSHDAHNLIAIGDNDDDIIVAINELTRVQGGYTIVQQGQVLFTLPLPIMGLMSDAGYEAVERILGEMIQCAHAMGVPLEMDPFITLSFIALPVIPDIRITTRGIFDVTKQEFYSEDR